MRTGWIKTADVGLGKKSLIKAYQSQNRPASSRFNVEGQITQIRFIRIFRLCHLHTRMIEKSCPAQYLEDGVAQLISICCNDRLPRQDYHVPTGLDARLEFL